MNDTILSEGGMSWVSILGIGAAIVVVLVLLFWFLNRRGHMAFMRGGSNRQPRLAVLDAAAVDSRRRLVLVRRDNVEHLILIGGPTDVVVEGGIHRSKAPQADGAKQPNPKTVARPGKPRPQPKPQQTEQPPEQQAAPAAKAIVMEPLEIPKSPDSKTPDSKTPEPKTPEPKTPEPPTPEPRSPETATMTAVSRGPAAQQPAPVQKPQVVSAPQLAAVAAAATASGTVSASPHSQAADAGSDIISEIASVRNGNVAAAGHMPAAPATRHTQNDLTAEFEEAFDAAPDVVASEPGQSAESTSGGSESDPWLAMVAEQQKTADNAASYVAPTVGPGVAPIVGPGTHQNPSSVDEPLMPNPSAHAEPIPQGEPVLRKDNPEELVAGFDKVLEAEINRSEKDAPEITESEAAAEAVNGPDGRSQSATLEDEMKKLLGDLSPKKE